MYCVTPCVFGNMVSHLHYWLWQLWLLQPPSLWRPNSHTTPSILTMSSQYSRLVCCGLKYIIYGPRACFSVQSGNFFWRVRWHSAELCTCWIYRQFLRAHWLRDPPDLRRHATSIAAKIYTDYYSIHSVVTLVHMQPFLSMKSNLKSSC